MRVYSVSPSTIDTDMNTKAIMKIVPDFAPISRVKELLALLNLFIF